MKWINDLLFFLNRLQLIKLILMVCCILSSCWLQAQNVADFSLDKLGDNLFQVSMTANQDYPSPTNRVSNMQIVLRVRTGGFNIANLSNLINTGLANEVRFQFSSRNDTPAENPQYDYLSFNLQSTGTTDIPFVNGQTVPLFTFQNGGTCTQDTLSLITPTDPFYPPNTIGANSNHQLTVLGYGAPDAPVGTTGTNVADCINNCIVEYEIERMTTGHFQVSLTPMATYNFPNNRVSSMQITLKVKTGGFAAGDLINLIQTGTASEVRFDNTTRFNTPVENPGYDYLSFTMLNTSTTEIPFQIGQKVPLFSFRNVGLCTEDTVRLITPTDPFYPPNSGNLNSGHQITVLGFGSSDAPVCTNDNGAADCTRECFMGCNDNVHVSLGLNCIAEVKPEMVATALTLTCPNGPKTVEVLENGVVIPTSPFLNESHIGRTFEVRVIDSITSNSCWGSIIVKDKTGPVVTCSDDTLNCAVADYSPGNPLVGYPTVRDNCTDTITDLTYSDRIIANGCGTPFSGRVERTWTAVDSVGRAGICIQNIYFTRLSLDSVAFPVNRDGFEGPIVECSNGATDPANTGAPTLQGDPLYPSLIGFCQIDAGFSDDSVSFCTGQKQIIRTWTAVDACTGDFRTDIQIISVQDTTPPEIICLDTIDAGVTDGICSGTVVFPAATVTDECSGASVRIETPFGNIDANGGTLSWIPMGYHEVVYVAIDACNNISRCTTILHVRDRTIPVAVCDFINDVSLRVNGTVEVQANAFNDGSRDDCSGNQLTFKVKRLGDTLDFADFVTFYCMDAGDTVNVVLQVADLDGNTDECTGAIVISNGSAPQIDCPDDLTIQCTDDYSNLNIFGTPIITDDCGGTTSYTESNTTQINSCGTGSITRTFTVSHAGGTISCEQVITIAGGNSFDGSTIVWPQNYSAFACTDTASLVPDALPDGFNVPSYDTTGVECNRILRSHRDALFDDVTDPVGCFTIFRTWTLIDDCIFDPNDTLAGGYWSHVQRIDLVNNVGPVFSNCPTDTIVDITDNSCSAYISLVPVASDDCLPESLVQYSYTIDFQDDGTIDDSTGVTNDLSGQYVAGTHRVTLTASDDCGNATVCTFLITVRDQTLPVSVCNSDTLKIENIGDELIAPVAPAELALNSSDNCTNYGNLSFSATPAILTCNELGLTQVTVTVTDEAGNSNSCVANVLVEDTDLICPTNRTMVNISGIVISEKGERVDQVEVSINHPEISASMTNEQGEFMLSDVPVGKDYTLLPKRDFDILNGISTFDLVLLNRHILDVEPIKSPYRLIAADVNKSGTITAFDIVLLRRLILRLSNTIPNNTSWRFVRTDYQFDNPKESYKSFFPEVYNINDLPGKDMQVDGFIAVKIGDINGSAVYNKDRLLDLESRNSSSSIDLWVPDVALTPGESVVVPVKASQFKNILGYQFALEFDPTYLEFSEVVPDSRLDLKEGNFGLDFSDRGLITVSWEQAHISDRQKEHQELFTLKFKTKKSGVLSDILFLAPKLVPAEAYAVNDQKTIGERGIELKFESSPPPGNAGNGLQVYQNRPNPFKHKTHIGFEMDREETVVFNIFNITGKIITSERFVAQQGYNELIISNKRLAGKGVYYYRISTSDNVQTRKMLVVE